MRITRRTFVHTLQGVALAGLAERKMAAQARTVLNVPGLTLISGSSLLVAANAAAETFCEVEIREGDRGVMAVKWSLGKDRPEIERRPDFDTAQERPGPRRYDATVTIGNPNVSVAVAIAQERRDGPRGRATGGRVTGPAADPGGAARNARFIDDPARQPGNFLISLPSDSTVDLRICAGTDTSQKPVHTNFFKQVALGVQRIPWDLQRNVGGSGRVPAGRYTAVLVCTPRDQGFLPTNLISYFAVLAP